MPESQPIKRRLFHHALGLEQQLRSVIRWWAAQVNITDLVGPMDAEVRDPGIRPPSPSMAKETLLLEVMSKCFFRNLWNARMLEVETGVEFVRKMMEELGAMQAMMPPFSKMRDPGPPPPNPPPIPDDDAEETDAGTTEEPQAEEGAVGAHPPDPGLSPQPRDAGPEPA